MEGPLPSSSHAPSTWYDAVATPHLKPVGNVRAAVRPGACGVVMSDLLCQGGRARPRSLAVRPAPGPRSGQAPRGEQGPVLGVEGAEPVRRAGRRHCRYSATAPWPLSSPLHQLVADLIQLLFVVLDQRFAQSFQGLEVLRARIV